MISKLQEELNGEKSPDAFNSHSDKHQINTNGKNKPLPSHDGKEVANASEHSKVALLQPLTQSKIGGFI